MALEHTGTVAGAQHPACLPVKARTTSAQHCRASSILGARVSPAARLRGVIQLLRLPPLNGSALLNNLSSTEALTDDPLIS